MEEEVWKTIIGYEDIYEVSNKGRIKSLGRDICDSKRTYYRKEFILKCYNKRGYENVKLYNGFSESKIFSVHRLVAIAFIPNLNNCLVVNHKNGIKNDNRVENLEWCTHSYNVKHAYDIGLTISCKGENNRSSILSELDVLTIREIYGKNGNSYNFLARKYNTVPTNIYSIIKRNSWKHI